MDTVNWRFNSNSDEAIEFRRFHYQLAATIKNVLVVGYHLKGFLFDGHFPHYISLDWVSLNCWDIMRYQPRSHWYLEQEISFVRHFALHCALPAWPVSASSHGTDQECETFYESEEIKCRHGMEYSIWTAKTLFIPDNPRLPNSHCSQWHDYWIMFYPSRVKLIFHQIPLNEVEKELFCKCL